MDAAFGGDGAAGMDDEAAAARKVAREGRLWANLFVYALDAGRFEVRPRRAACRRMPAMPLVPWAPQASTCPYPCCWASDLGY